MNFEEEIKLLIKSKYPVVFVETIDEEHTVRQISSAANSLGIVFYRWSVTQGLQFEMNENSFYHTSSPAMMLKTALDIVDSGARAVFILKDFHKFLNDAVLLRFFKDIIAKIKDTAVTIVIIGGEYGVPEEIKPYVSRITGGYPDDREIIYEINKIAQEFKNSKVKFQMDLSPVELTRLVKTLKGLSILQIRSVINRCVISDARLSGHDMPEIEKFKKEIFDKEGCLEYYGSEIPSNIAGFENLKKWIAQRKNSVFSGTAALPPRVPEAMPTAEDSTLPPPKGVLLLGVQGCGKSLAAKVIAGELGIALYRLDLNRLYSKYIGETEENLRKALKTVEMLSPVCLWIDEIEKIFASSSGEIDGGVSQRVLGTFLTWMQERKDRNFLAATSNNINGLPAEFLRKGRFDEIFFADLPEVPEREEILRIHLAKRNLNPAEFDLKLLTGNSGGFSGAEIEQAIISALYSSSSANERISTRHVLEQINLTRPLSIIKSEDINFLRNWAKERAILPV
ncbi:MAG: AAA family ATPase [Elusimicrobia bacterium]|nr:AAA family ATPase [Elusimicrobiota bacterium]